MDGSVTREADGVSDGIHFGEHRGHEEHNARFAKHVAYPVRVRDWLICTGFPKRIVPKAHFP